MFKTCKHAYFIIFSSLAAFLIYQQECENEELLARFNKLEVSCRKSQQSLQNSLNQTTSQLPFIIEKYRKKIIKDAQVNVVYIVSDENKGSGFFINDQGLMVSNCHVVGTSDKVNILTWNNNWCHAKVIATDAVADIALIQLNEDDLKKLRDSNTLPKGAQFANSDNVDVGDFIFTMGAPHNKIKTVSAGQVSNTARYLNSLPILDKISGLYYLYIQVDSGIMPGHSGGPSINLKGEVIGINTRANYDNNAEGYLLPINIAKERIDNLLTAHDKTNHYNTIGFEMNPYLAHLDDDKNYLPAAYSSALRVDRIAINSVAFKQGWRDGDLILEINERAVDLQVKSDAIKYRTSIAFSQPGTELSFKVIRLEDERIEEVSLVVQGDTNVPTPPSSGNRVLQFFPISSRR